MPRRTLRKVRWKVLVSEEIAATIEEKIWDPLLQKPRYGGRSGLIEFLLRYYIEHPEIMPPVVSPELMQETPDGPEPDPTDPELALALRLAGLRSTG